MSQLAAYHPLLRPFRGLTAAAVLLGGASALLEGVALGALLPVIDASGPAAQMLGRWLAAAGVGPKRLLLVSLVGFVMLVLVAAAARAWSEILLVKVKTVIEKRVRQTMTDALLGMRWSRFISVRQGDIGKAMVMEGLQIGTGAQHLVGAWGSALAAACYFVMAVFISPSLAGMSLLFGAFGGLVYVLGARRVRRSADALSRMSGEIGERVNDVFGNLKYFRSTGMEAEMRARAVDLFDDFADTYYRSQVFSPVLRGVVEALAGLFVAAFLFHHLAIAGGSIAAVLVFLGIFYRMAPRLLNLQNSLFQARTYITWLRSYEERMQMAGQAAEASRGGAAVTFGSQIEFRQVGYRYDGADVDALDGIDLALRRGETLAFVGASGGGKSTLVDLLTGLLVATRGSLTVDGVDMRNIDIELWRHRIGIVMQDTLMLNDSVARNVALGEGSPDPDKVERCLRAADAWDFVSRLPLGIDTVVAEHGARFSGGQRQRLAIARALYREPLLLILDEATSALDSESEERIQRVIEDMRGRMTIVQIAHRLKTVQSADRIVVLREGRVCESGAWNDLMSQRGELFRLASLQNFQ